MRRTRLAVAVAVATSAVVVGLPATSSAAPQPATPAADVPVQLVAMNDFHGRISETTGTDAELTNPDGSKVVVGGAASVASTVDEAQAAFVAAGGDEASTFFVGAGDLISASPFNSSVFKDEPTIEVLNAMGLDVSSVGNHEFDRGTEELRRISGATDGTYSDDVKACDGVSEAAGTGCFTDSTGEHFHGTDFPYLAANVLVKGTTDPALPPYQVFDVAGGKKIALIGVVTETTPTIVSPAGVQDVTFIDEADAVNRWVPELQKQGIEAIGVLVHEGGTNTGSDASSYNGCDQLSGPVVDINNRVVPAVDLIVSAHSHTTYDCFLADPAGQPRMVTQAGFYGRLVTDIRLTLDGKTGDVKRFCAGYEAANVPVLRDNPDAEVAAIVKYWNDKSAVAGNRVVGNASADITSYVSSDRKRETPLTNLLAQEQLEALQSAAFGNPVIGFINPGGARANIDAGVVTYGDLYAVQPFGNTVNAITLTGADIRAILEQQFQADRPKASGGRESQLILGTSEGFAYEYDLSQPYGARVNPASIVFDPDGNSGPAPVQPVVATDSYRVVANSFLITGGDSFTAFTNGTNPVSGPFDVDTLVAYFEARNSVAPPAADHSKAVTFAAPVPPAAGLGGTTGPVTPPAVADGNSAVESPGVGPACDATAAISKPTPVRAQTVAVTGTKFGPREKVTVTIDDGRVVGSGTAGATGDVSVRFKVPVDLAAGQHTVTLTGASGEKASTTFTLEPVRNDVRTVISTIVTKLINWLFR
ncbi:5'-nucleotidase C-terminal domain-containing protein [Blastococcus litoris]|uniref:5'-nucleotidase C-terminal domain-containing protein n=1 Tax=Blastococcus litoris TaxID=2171622 RepID=UPI000E30AAF6|nr:5'-nucleotidase C-terminal domain-containing protein [Blastococcus litoris]